MTFQLIWPLWFLVLILGIILLYLLKQKPQDQMFSSTLLWKEIYKNLEAKTPFEKLKHNILMYIQILIMLALIFALMSPFIKSGISSDDNVIIVIDNSASMSYLYEDMDSRLDAAKDMARSQIENLPDGVSISLVVCGSDSQVLYQGNDIDMAAKRLDEINETLEEGTLDNGAVLINSLISAMANVEIFCYTDTEFDRTAYNKNNTDASVTVYGLYNEGENFAVEYINYDADSEENTVDSICRVANYGNETITRDVSLLVDNELADVQEVELAAGESVTVYFNRIQVDFDSEHVLTAKISGEDSLAGDDSRSIVLTPEKDYDALLISDGNVFLEKGISADSAVTVSKTDDITVPEQADSDYNLYVYDGVEGITDWDKVIEENPSAAYIFMNYETDISEKGYVNLSGKAENVYLSFAETDITGYISGYTFGVVSCYTYELPDWGTALIRTEDGQVTAYYGETDGIKIAVIGFDIHDTDLALQTEYPIFMTQLTGWLLDEGAGDLSVENFPVETESVIEAVTESAIAGNKSIIPGAKNLRNYLLMAALILLVAEWIIYYRQKVSGRKRMYLVVRCLVMAVIILAMAGLSIKHRDKRAETVFLVDVSDSMSGSLSDIEEYLEQQISAMPDKNSYGIVVFGKSAAVEQFMTDENGFAGFSAAVAASATNIETALQAGMSMFGDDVSKQMILITDGAENDGTMSTVSSAIKNSDINLAVIQTEDYIGNNPEVYLDEIILPSKIYVGNNYNVTVTVESNIETNANLTLYEGRNVKEQVRVHLTKGSNSFVFSDTAKEGSLTWYKAVIDPDEDSIYVNNTGLVYTEVDAVPKVLVIEGMLNESEEFQKVLKAANLDYDVITPAAAPVSVSQLNSYKAVVTVDVHYDDLPAGFGAVLSSYVKDYAGGYACIGGENSYALGGYNDTELEEILPVNMELTGEKEIPKLAMVMVIDHSGSMLSAAADNRKITCLTLAKQAAIAAANELRDTDEVGVIAFSDTYSWTVNLGSAADKDAVETAITGITEGGGTNIYPALREAYTALTESDAKLKHIVLLTDGQDTNNYSELMEKLNEAGITVSTVAIGTDADTTTLSSLADNCGGRYYYSDGTGDLPRIFAQEVYLSTNTYLVNETFYPVITKNSDILQGVFDDGSPALYGYVATTAKQTATVILETPSGDPLLSVWQCGLGKTIAWCSDGDNQWTAECAAWENYPLLWGNIINYIISDTSVGEDSVDFTKTGDQLNITYDTEEYGADTLVTAVITDDEGNSYEVTLTPSNAGTYTASVSVENIGLYNVSIRKYNGETLAKNINTAYANQYSAEYRFSDGSTELAQFISMSGARSISFQDDIWDLETNTTVRKNSITVPLIIIAILLFMYDIISRRFLLASVMAGRRKHKKSRDKKSGKNTEEKTVRRTSLIMSTDDNYADTETPDNEAGKDPEDMKKSESRKNPEDMKKSESRKKSDNKKKTDMLDMNTLLQKKHDREER